MKRHSLATVVLAVATSSCCMGDTFTDFHSTPVATMGGDAYRYGATTDGKMTRWDVSFSDVQDTPDWSPGEEPPLPISKAIALAEREVEKYTTTPGAYRLEKVEWLHIGNHMNSAQKWIYLVTFERRYQYRGQTFESRGTLTIPVLLDGRVIQGRTE